jgi:hypothetical protein
MRGDQPPAAFNPLAELEPGTRIYPEDLEAWEKKAGVKVMPGDALLVRTGRWTWMKTMTPSPSALPREVAGLDASVIPWLKKRDIALLGSEQAQDAAPYREDLPPLPVHPPATCCTTFGEQR